jgi:hypothetical protein
MHNPNGSHELDVQNQSGLRLTVRKSLIWRRPARFLTGPTWMWRTLRLRVRCGDVGLSARRLRGLHSRYCTAELKPLHAAWGARKGRCRGNAR